MAQQLLSILLQEKKYNNKYSCLLITMQKHMESCYTFGSAATHLEVLLQMLLSRSKYKKNT